MRTRLPLLIVTLGALLGVAPATRPTPAVPTPARFQLRVCSYAGADVVSSVDLTVEPGVPFATKARVGDTTLTLDGTLRSVGRHAWRVQVRYDESTVYRANSGGHKMVSTTLEPDLGREFVLSGGGSPAGPQWKTAMTLTATP